MFQIKMNYIRLTVCLSVILAVIYNVKSQDSIALKYGNTIKADDLKRHLSVIASDEYEGRETGKKGQKLAADYIANYFNELELESIMNNSYFQSIPLNEEKWDTNTNISIYGKSYTLFNNFYGYNRSVKQAKISKKNVVFIGYGIDTDNYSDYKGIDVEGKIVLMLQDEPRDKKNISYISKDNELSKWSTNWKTKLKKAQQAGVSMILFVDFDITTIPIISRHYIEHTILKINSDTSESNYAKNIYISETMANKLLSSTSETIQELKSKIDKKGKSSSFEFKSDIIVDIKKHNILQESENVLGYLKGNDLEDEVIIISAHYDHCGKKDNKIYNGADDNGSGTAAILELAEAFVNAKKLGVGPKRSILFMSFTGEEKGQIGSKYYTQNPVFSLENTIANLNIDMIGRVDSAHIDNPEYVYVIGSNMLSTELHKINETANNIYTKIELDYTYNDLDDPTRYYYRSDHYNFAKNNIPVIFYFNGTHPDYHKPTDTIDKINFPIMEKRTRLIFYTLWELANREKRISLDIK